MATAVWLRLPLAVCALHTLAAFADGETPTGPPVPPKADSPSLFGRIFTQSIGTQSIGQVPAWNLELPRPAAPLHGDADPTPPSTLVYLRVSQEYLSRRFERNVSRTKPVVDYILGTSIRGQSLTRGSTRLVLVPNADQFAAEIEFTGTVDSNTRGTNGPAILHYKSDSTFRATKRITLSAAGISTAPARATATTQLQPQRIGSRYSGLMGAVVERVARHRIAQTQSQANAIASRHTARRIEGDLDRGVEKSVAALTAALAEAAGLKPTELAQLITSGASDRLHLKLRTTRDHAELVLTPVEVTWSQLADFLPAVDDSSHVTLRVHRSILTNSGTTSPALANLLAAGLRTHLAKRTAAIVELPAGPPAGPTTWSVDLHWLSVDIRRADNRQDDAFRSAQAQLEPLQPSIGGGE